MNIGFAAPSHTPQTKTTIETGSSSAKVSSERVRFTKDAQVSQASAVQESFVRSSAPEESPVYSFNPAFAGGDNTAVKFSSLSPEDRKVARQTMQELNKNARLFARNEDQELVRISPAAGKERLDRGMPVEVVTRLATETSSRSSSALSNSFQQHFWVPNDHSDASHSVSSSTVKAEYSSSPISDWDSVLWHEGEDYAGIPGTPKLPASGQPVTVSSQWENKWSESSVENFGIFRLRTESSANSGYERVSKVAEG